MSWVLFLSENRYEKQKISVTIFLFSRISLKGRKSVLEILKLQKNHRKCGPAIASYWPSWCSVSSGWTWPPARRCSATNPWNVTTMKLQVRFPTSRYFPFFLSNFFPLAMNSASYGKADLFVILHTSIRLIFEGQVLLIVKVVLFAQKQQTKK